MSDHMVDWGLDTTVPMGAGCWWWWCCCGAGATGRSTPEGVATAARTHAKATGGRVQ